LQGGKRESGHAPQRQEAPQSQQTSKQKPPSGFDDIDDDIPF
jgi:single-stranded DNA-binding protein